MFNFCRRPIVVSVGLVLLFSGIARSADDLPMPAARGVLRAVDEASLSIDTSLKVVSVPFKAGQAFKKGDVLIAFDCERLEAERQIAEAEARSAQASFKSSSRLHAQRAAGALEVTIAEAEAQKAAAGVAIVAVRLKACRQVAPYDGRIVDVMVHENDTPTANAPLVKIINSERVEVDVIIPSHWLRWLTVGAGFRFKVDETGQDVEGVVTQIGATVDPVSQTVKITGRLETDPQNTSPIVPGMSGTAVFQPHG